MRDRGHPHEACKGFPSKTEAWGGGGALGRRLQAPGPVVLAALGPSWCRWFSHVSLG